MKIIEEKPLIPIIGPSVLLEEIKYCRDRHAGICECWRDCWDLIYYNGSFHGQKKL